MRRPPRHHRKRAAGHLGRARAVRSGVRVYVEVLNEDLIADNITISLIEFTW